MIARLINRLRNHRYWKSRVQSARQHAISNPPDFGQAKEDAIAAILLGNIDTFIDIGANDGILFSNTWHAACNGARGGLFEPIGETFWRLSFAHRRNKNAHCIQGAVGSKRGVASVELAGYGGLLSSIDPTTKVNEEDATIAMSEAVKIDTLEGYLNRVAFVNDCDLLSIDVEGYELEVIQGIDFSSRSFKVIIIETDSDDESFVLEVDRVLGANGYVPHVKTPFNTIFCSRDFVPPDNYRAKIAQLAVQGLSLLVE